MVARTYFTPFDAKPHQLIDKKLTESKSLNKTQYLVASLRATTTCRGAGSATSSLVGAVTKISLRAGLVRKDSRALDDGLGIELEVCNVNAGGVVAEPSKLISRGRRRIGLASRLSRRIEMQKGPHKTCVVLAGDGLEHEGTRYGSWRRVGVTDNLAGVLKPLTGSGLRVAVQSARFDVPECDSGAVDGLEDGLPSGSGQLENELERWKGLDEAASLRWELSVVAGVLDCDVGQMCRARELALEDWPDVTDGLEAKTRGRLLGFISSNAERVNWSAVGSSKGEDGLSCNVNAQGVVARARKDSGSPPANDQEVQKRDMTSAELIRDHIAHLASSERNCFCYVNAGGSEVDQTTGSAWVTELWVTCWHGRRRVRPLKQSSQPQKGGNGSRRIDGSGRTASWRRVEAKNSMNELGAIQRVRTVHGCPSTQPERLRTR
ncbi:hypothetical protein FPV67DRAFT_1707510 [Lyophyllum atratum]|nr:hypothetical protein FPV67DRAFT_1707510 [Lyophyllum atratum]